MADSATSSASPPVSSDHERSVPEVSIVVPTYKEAENIPLLLAAIRQALGDGHSSGLSYEIVIVDDDSPDATAELCQLLASPAGGTYPLRLITRKGERGLSSAVIRGFAAARGRFLLCMDADLSHPPSAIPAMLELVRSGQAELVIGSRYVPGGSTDATWSLFRHLNSRVATLLALPFSGGASDPMAGFFLLSRDTYARHDPLSPVGYKILLEIICKCHLRHVAEVPIHFADRRYGKSKLNLSEQLRYLQHLVRLYEYKYSLFYQATHFTLVGVSGMVLDLLAAHIALHILAEGVALSRAVGILVALPWNFYLNRRFTFPEKRHEGRVLQFLKFATGCAPGGLLNFTISIWAYHHLPLFQGGFTRSAILGVITGALLNFVLAKLFVFGDYTVRRPLSRALQ